MKKYWVGIRSTAYHEQEIISETAQSIKYAKADGSIVTERKQNKKGIWMDSKESALIFIGYFLESQLYFAKKQLRDAEIRLENFNKLTNQNDTKTN